MQEKEMITPKNYLDVGDNTKSLINGYIHEIEKEFINIIDNQIIIPLVICQLCTIFFYEFDEWNDSQKTEGLVINNKTKSIYSSTHSIIWSTIFGKKVCGHNLIHFWEFQLIKITKKEVNNSWKIAIGIVPSYYTKTTSTDYSFVCGNYAFITGQAKINKAFLNGQILYSSHNYGVKFGEKINDKLIMILDLVNYTLSFIINDIKYGIATKIIPNEYKLAISICNGRHLKLIKSGTIISKTKPQHENPMTTKNTFIETIQRKYTTQNQRVFKF